MNESDLALKEKGARQENRNSETLSLDREIYIYQNQIDIQKIELIST